MNTKKNGQENLKKMQKWIADNRKTWLEEYQTFLRFPSISSEPHYKQDVINCAQWLSDYLKEMNFEVELWKTNGHPVVFASNLRAGPDKPTLLIYNHYDVQPVDPIEEWISPPFEPQIRDGQVYARGAQDNKGQCFYVIQALKLLQDTTGSLPINIKLIIEGEEEHGSTALAELLPQKKKELKADYLAIVDLVLRRPHVPALTLGLRGLITLDVVVEGSATDLHSGCNGGIVPNPIHALIRLLGNMRDANGSITVPGFYDDVKDMSKEERSAVSFEFDEDEFHKQTGAFATGGETGFSPIERAWIRPTLEINGINGGYSGTGFKTVIPAKAIAKISCRLVPDQEPEKIKKLLKAYLEKNAPAGVKVKVTPHSGHGKPFRVSPNAALVKAFAKAFEEVFNHSCEFIYEGSTIPITVELSKVCGGETILFGLGLTTDQIHAPNEHFGLDRLEKGMLAVALGLLQLQISKN